MGYTSRYAGEDLTDEEQDVRTALAEYSGEGATHADWVPTGQLYRVYRLWLAEHRWRFDPDAPASLLPRQFGRAVRRLFPETQRCRRRYHGRERWGYCRILGPEAIRSRRMDSDPLG